MILIRNAKIWTMSGEIIQEGSILIEKGKIKEVGQDVVAPLDAKIIDAEGGNILPGFIEAHCHIGLFEDGLGFEGEDGNEMTHPITPNLRAIDAINPMDRSFQEARENGITTCITGPGSTNVIGGQFAAVKTYGQRVEDMLLKEPIAMKCAFGENPKRVYSSQKKSPVTRMATAALLREALMEAKEYAKKKERAESEKDQPKWDMKMESLVKVLNKEIPLKAHAHRADDILTAIRVAKEFDVNMTLDHCTEGHLIADIIKEEGLDAIVGPTLSSRSKIELNNLTFKTPEVLNKKGVRIALTTDHPVVPVQYLPVCAALATREGMEELEALRAITLYPAQIVGIEDRVGSIEVGKDADLVLIKDHPLDFRSKVRMTIINGEVVYDRGEIA
ncbi:amidohydrolase [Irregularibacter muris]|uniref:Amidohydrolase n=1 Tax=Irregularibacter muris TaxID=1796619 RepID=A0AAE3HF03_9FIRM|nr:amidohydrolase [Irregularibacter muris]MCR1899376.1 amidohydrolase [Irregularibacter muris]